MAFLRQVEVEHGGFEVCMAHVTLNSAEVDASFEQMGGIGMAERMDSDVALRIPARWVALRKAPWTLLRLMGVVAVARCL